MVWLGLHRLIRGASHRAERERSIPSSHLLPPRPCALTDPLQFMAGHYALLFPPSLAHSHQSRMGPKASKIETIAWEQTQRKQDVQQFPPAAAAAIGHPKAQGRQVGVTPGGPHFHPLLTYSGTLMAPGPVPC